MLTPAKRSLPALGAGIWQLDVGAGALVVVEGVEGAVVAVPGTHWKYAARTVCELQLALSAGWSHAPSLSFVHTEPVAQAVEPVQP